MANYYYLFEDTKTVEVFETAQDNHEGSFLGASENPNIKMAATMVLRNNGFWDRGYRILQKD